MGKAAFRNIKGCALRSVSYFLNVFYFHYSAFAQHVETSSSLHNWCKQKVYGFKISAK